MINKVENQYWFPTFFFVKQLIFLGDSIFLSL